MNIPEEAITVIKTALSDCPELADKPAAAIEHIAWVTAEAAAPLIAAQALRDAGGDARRCVECHKVHVPHKEVVSVRLSDEELARLDQLVQVHEMDRSAVLRRLIGSAELWAWRFEIPLRPKGHYCSCQLIDVSTSPAEPDFVRGRPDGCKVHGVDWDAKVAAAKRRAREA